MPRLPLPLRPLYVLLWLAGSAPLWLIDRLGRALGWVPLLLRTREATVARRSIALCFPGLDPAAQRALLVDTLQHTARTLLETLRLWTRSPARTLPWIREVVGFELFERARADGRGLIIAAPHLGNWELLNRYLATLGPLAIVYRAPERRALEPLLVNGRGGDSIRQLRAEPGSVRGMLRHLAAGGILGLLPDQKPGGGEGESVPFFGQPARTMTLLPRLAQRAGVPVLFAFAERLPAAAGFRIRFLPAPDGIDAADPVRGATALNAGVEACARLAPAQYQWTYRRFARSLPLPPAVTPDPPPPSDTHDHRIE
jgi:Kdo2-lipid IVA lauroyltransferase/acyltransferase